MTGPLPCARHNAFSMFTVKCSFHTQRLAASLKAGIVAYAFFSSFTIPFTGLGTGQALDEYLVDFGTSQVRSSVKK